MSEARPRIPPEIENLHFFRLMDCIQQSNLGERDGTMVKMYLVGKISQEDIAAEMMCTRRTVSTHIAKAIKKIERTAKTLYKDWP